MVRLTRLDQRQDGNGEAVGPGLDLTNAHDEVAGAGPTGEDGSAGRSPVERVPGAGAVGHVEVGPRRLHDDEGQPFVALGHRQMGGGADRVGQLLEDRPGLGPHEGGDRGGEPADSEAEADPPARPSRDEVVGLEGRDEPIDDGAADIELRGQLGDGQAAGPARKGQQLEQLDPTVQRLGALRRRSSGGRRGCSGPVERSAHPPSGWAPSVSCRAATA